MARRLIYNDVGAHTKNQQQAWQRVLFDEGVRITEVEVYLTNCTGNVTLQVTMTTGWYGDSNYQWGMWESDYSVSSAANGMRSVSWTTNPLPEALTGRLTLACVTGGLLTECDYVYSDDNTYPHGACVWTSNGADGTDDLRFAVYGSRIPRGRHHRNVMVRSPQGAVILRNAR